MFAEGTARFGTSVNRNAIIEQLHFALSVSLIQYFILNECFEYLEKIS